MLDIDVTTMAMSYVALGGTPEEATAACRAEPDPLTGVKLAARIAGASLDITVSDLTRLHCTPIPDVTAALSRRGAFLVDPAGSVGVAIGRGLVVQPAGRRYMLCASTPDRWVTAWWPTTVTATMTS